MELKSINGTANTSGTTSGSNRTFMELKLYNNASFFDLFTF